MKSTGEVMGIDETFLSSYIKSQIACGNIYHLKEMYLFQLMMTIKKHILNCKKINKFKFKLICN